MNQRIEPGHGSLPNVTDGKEGGCGPKIAFVVGAPRSGTTLLVERLARHPEVVATPETHFFANVCHSPRLAGRKLDLLDAARLYASLARRLGEGSGADIPPSLPFGEGATVADVARSAFTNVLRRSGKRLLVEKTPDHALYLDAIATVFPGAAVIFVVRDPRDVSLSWMGVPWSPAGLLYPGIRWMSIDRAIAAESRKRRLPILTVRYESLIQDETTELRRIQEFLRLPERSLASSCATSQTFDAGLEFWKAQATQPVDRKNAGKWRTEMSMAHQLMYNMLLGSALLRSGYGAADVSLRDVGIGAIFRILVEEGIPTARQLPGLWLRRWRWVTGLNTRY